MPVKPDSRFASLPVFEAVAPDGSRRHVIGMLIGKFPAPATAEQYRVVQGECVDLVARRLFGAEGLWWRLLDANPLIYPLDIEPGAQLSLPEPGQATRITRARRF